MLILNTLYRSTRWSHYPRSLEVLMKQYQTVGIPAGNDCSEISKPISIDYIYWIQYLKIFRIR